MVALRAHKAKVVGSSPSCVKSFIIIFYLNQFVFKYVYYVLGIFSNISKRQKKNLLDREDMDEGYL